MRISSILSLLLFGVILWTGCGPQRVVTVYPQEKSFISNVRQLTFDGENAEGYFSFDEKKFSFQHRNADSGIACDQIYTYDLASGAIRRISNGQGATTCSYFMPGDSLVLYASTFMAGSQCPPPPDRSHGYAWALHGGFDIFVADLNGNIVKRLTDTPGYDAEATVSPTADKIIFTSTRTGDIELFSMNTDGTGVRQLTNTPGYDGGAFYSWDGKKVVYRADHPQGDNLEKYKTLLAKELVKPSHMELFVMNADGSGVRQITSNGKANFAPFWHPDGKHIIFASNMDDPKGRNFDLYLIGEDGTGLTRITYNDTFDGFPMFTRDGRRLIFASNRNSVKPGETNLFICDFTLPGQ